MKGCYVAKMFDFFINKRDHRMVKRGKVEAIQKMLQMHILKVAVFQDFFFALDRRLFIEV